MNELERTITDLLHTGTPEPERVITSREIAGLVQDERPAQEIRRWGVPLLAAAAVLVAAAIPVLLVGHADNSAAPTSPVSQAPTPTVEPSPTPSITAGAVATCLSSQLSLMAGSQDGTAGSTYVSFYFANTAAAPCSLHGFPGVALLNDAGSTVGQPATRDGSEGPSVRLGPGQRALFVLRVGTATRTGCDMPRPSSQVQVYPPDQLVPLRIPFNTASCQLSVQSLRTP